MARIVQRKTTCKIELHVNCVNTPAANHKNLFLARIFVFNLFKYINSGTKLDNNKYNQSLPHIYVMRKWTANNYFL